MGSVALAYKYAGAGVLPSTDGPFKYKSASLIVVRVDICLSVKVADTKRKMTEPRVSA